MRRVIAVALVALAACSNHAATTHQLHGTLTLRPKIVADTLHATCSGSVIGSGYSDLTAGAPVVVKNGTGAVLVVTQLGQGMLENAVLGRFGWAGECVWHFTVTVPDSRFYSVEVSHRGGVTFSKTQLASNGWKADLSLG